MIYCPHCNADVTKLKIVHYGGKSTMERYNLECDKCGWKCVKSGINEVHAVLRFIETNEKECKL